jgi:hypothetical protein
MSERFFLLGELSGDYQMTELGLKVGAGSEGWLRMVPITETELKHRLQEIIDADHTMEDCLEILIHGHGERGER